MARRRQIDTPSPEDLARLDREAEASGFAAKPRAAPIAQVVADAAQAGSPLTVEAQEAQARDRVEADRARQARADGWEVAEIPIDEIGADAFSRDRAVIESAALEELRQSIRVNGLRLPIEVVARDGGGYDLISGLRRLMATRDVAGQGGTIRAFVRPSRPQAELMVSMVEENEVRANLSSYERGRAAVLAAQDGVFPSIEAAVDAMFATASKAKRSKVRSFALVHEVLGDMLAFPQDLSERQCLRLAGAIKAGQGEALRTLLARGGATDAAAEWAMLADGLAAQEAPGARSRPARPKRPSGASHGDPIPLPGGGAIRHVEDAEGHSIRFDAPVDRALVDAVMLQIRHMLTPTGTGKP